MEKLERDKLIVEHLWCCDKAAQKAAHRMSIDYDDAYSICCVRLVACADKWRNDGKCKFSSFVFRCLHNELLEELRQRRRPMNKALYNPVRDFDIQSDEDIEKRIIAREKLLNIQRKAWRTGDKRIIRVINSKLTDTYNRRADKSTRTFYLVRQLLKEAAHG